MRKTLYKIGLFLLLCLAVTRNEALAVPLTGDAAEATLDEHASILLITSYNPDTRVMADNLTAFLETYRRRGCHNPISVETMNCKNLSEAPEWRERMAEILQKYEAPGKRPAMIILLGQEAWGAYLAQHSHLAQTTPSMCALGSDFTIELPTDTTDLAHWQPRCFDVNRDFPQFNIVGGLAYHYDIEANLNLARRYFPTRHKYIFLTDNTFGGVIMQACMRLRADSLMNAHETVEWMDGRTLNVTDVTSNLRAEGDSAVVMIGTWRIDCTENYVMGNITHLLREANWALPAFSVSSVGVNDWAIGGFSPQYQVVGGQLADEALDYLIHRKKPGTKPVRCLPSHYVFNYERLQDFHIKEADLPAGSEVTNRPVSFIQEHWMLVVVVLGIIVILSVSCGVAIYYLLRARRMNDELQAMSQDLIVARDNAEESNRLKSAFLANMSHEIRTPLNAIVGFSGVLVNEDVSDAERKQFSDIIRTNSDLLLHLINDILDLSRIESGRMQFVQENVEVAELCKSAVSTSEYARHSEAVFMFESPLTRLMMVTDGQRLQQVLINLLSNAAKFTPKGFITLRLTVDEANHEALFVVQDTGCGIPKDKAEKVFERFEKLDEYAQGTGLGLSICRVIVEHLGGRIWLDTEYHDGARFCFALPLVGKYIKES
jgi:signal transduction histidine kinase